MLLLLAIADCAHDDGNGAYPSVASLASKTRLSERDVQYRLRELLEGGAITCAARSGPRGVNVYAVVMLKGVQSLQVQVQ